MARAFDRKLVYRQPVVARRRGPVNQPHKVAPRLAVFLVLHRHARYQQAVKLPVSCEQRLYAQVQRLLKRIVPRRCRHAGVQPVNRRAQPLGQSNIAVASALRRRPVMRHVGAIGMRVAHLGQPGEGLAF